jgi:hypothetical protein
VQTTQTTTRARVTIQRWSAAVSSLVILHDKPCDGKHQHQQVRKVPISFLLLRSNQTMFIFHRVKIKPLSVHASHQTMPRFPRLDKQCVSLEIKPNLVGSCIQKRLNDALGLLLHRVFHFIALFIFEGLLQVLIHILTPCALTAHPNTTIVFV